MLIDTGEFNSFLEALEKAQNGDTSTDVVTSLYNLQDYLQSDSIELRDGPPDPKKYAESWIGHKNKRTRNELLTNIIFSYEDHGIEFCEKMTDEFIKLNPEKISE